MKFLHWIGGSKDDLFALPETVQRDVGYALHFAQCGDRHSSAKALKGFGGAGVLEIVENHDGDTYRAVYTVKFTEAVYVLHVFQKKSKTGSKTPAHEIRLVRDRLRQAETDHARRYKR